PVAGFSRDSDGNTRIRTAAGVDFAAADGVRVGLTAGRTVVSDAAGDRSVTDFTASTAWRPRNGIQMDAAGGAARAAFVTPTARVRLRVTAPDNKGGMDLRFNRGLLDATPALVENRIVRNEFQA